MAFLTESEKNYLAQNEKKVCFFSETVLFYMMQIFYTNRITFHRRNVWFAHAVYRRIDRERGHERIPHRVFYG